MKQNQPEDDSPSPRRKQVMDILMPLGFIAAYFLLQLWILPSIGVET